MSDKDLFSWVSHWRGGVFARWRKLIAFLVLLALLLGAIPFGAKWLLTQQLHKALKREVTIAAVKIHPFDLSVEVRGLSVKNAQGGELAGWERLTLDVSAQSFSQRALVLDALTLQGPRVSVVHLGQGRFDFSDLLGNNTKSPDTAWPRFVLRQVAVQGGRLVLEDRPHQRTHTVEALNLRLPLVNSLEGKDRMTLRPELSAKVNGASLKAHGAITPLAAAPAVSMTLVADQFDLTSLQDFVPPSVLLRLTRGRLSTELVLRIDADAPTTWQLSGAAKLEDLVLQDAHQHELLSFNALALKLASGDLLTRRFVFSEVKLDQPKVRVRVGRNGALNWKTALSPSSAPSAAPAPTSEPVEPIAPATPPLALQINWLAVNGGVIEVADASVTPAYQSRISDVQAVLSGFAIPTDTPAGLVLTAVAGSTATLEVQGRLNPMAVTGFSDMQLKLKNIELSHFSGYARKYMGYAVDKGKLSLDGTYQLQDKQLQAQNHLFIDQLTLGEQVDSPDAKNLPVSLGLTLLKNNRGEITIDMPMSGPMDAPDFSLGGLIAQTFSNVLVKAATAPFRFLGGLFGGADEGLSHVGFAAGAFALDEAARHKLNDLAKALNEREALHLELRGVFDAAADAATVQRKTLCEGAASGKDVLMQLAACRSQAVARWLIDEGHIAPERLFQLEPRARANDAPAGTGVLFSLR